MTLLVLGCFSAVACGSVRPSPPLRASASAVESPPPATAAPPSLAGWVEPADYEFTLESACGERSLIGTFRVTIRNHETVAFQGLDGSGGAFQGDPAAVPTLAGLLQEAEDARAGNASSVEVETDPVDGHPVTVAIDYLANAIDDEACYRVSDYLPAVPGSE